MSVIVEKITFQEIACCGKQWRQAYKAYFGMMSLTEQM